MGDIKFFAKHADANWSWGVSGLEPFQFPGGESHIKGVDSPKVKAQLAYMRGADADDLIMLAMFADAVHQREEKLLIALPYLPGARADRGNPFGAKVYADFINSLHADRVICLDPHSPIMPSLIERLTVYPVERVIRKVLGDQGDSYRHPYDGVIAPDKGARDRAQRAADVLHVPVFTAGKTRDFETGAISGFHMEDVLPEAGRFLIVDDICDGGGTFNGLADAIHENNGKRRFLDLWVTHGIFSKGMDELSERFEEIHTTDSWTEHPGPWSTSNPIVHNIGTYLLGDLNNA